MAYNFNLMVVGDTGLGKTTFINTLFKSELMKPNSIDNNSTVNVVPHLFEVEEDGVKLNLTVVDTPGFGKRLDKTQELDEILKYIDQQFECYFQGERAVKRKKDIEDTRIHCVLYFVSPWNHKGLKDSDIHFIRQLSTKANCIPVIGRADGLTVDELENLKHNIKSDFEECKLKMYPQYHTEEKDFADSLPFAVIGSNNLLNNTRVRNYQWAQFSVEEWSDSEALRTLIFRTNMQDLIDTTHSAHYTHYRSATFHSDIKPTQQQTEPQDEKSIEAYREELAADFKRKEGELKTKFLAQVQQRDKQFREQEEKLKAKRLEMIAELEAMQNQLAKERLELNSLNYQE